MVLNRHWEKYRPLATTGRVANSPRCYSSRTKPSVRIYKKVTVDRDAQPPSLMGGDTPKQSR